MLLTDPEGNVLCATEAAADLLSALPVRQLDPGINAKRGAAARRQSCYRAYAAFDGAAHARRRGAGRQIAIRLYQRAGGFPRLLLRIVLPLAVLLLAVSMYLSHVMSKPADILVEAAQKLSEGELVADRAALPPDLKPIGQAFNRMSHRLGAVLGEVGYERDMLALCWKACMRALWPWMEAGDMLA